MKALSFRQPWAELILQGRKTMDLRTYNTHHRGPLAIHASRTVERDACQEHGLDPDGLATGGIVGLVDVADVVLLTRDEYEARQDEHLAGRDFREGMYGWLLSSPQRLRRIVPARGRMSLFNVSLEGQADGASASPLLPARPRRGLVSYRAETATSDPDRPFALFVTPIADSSTSYSLTLAQRTLDPVLGEPRDEPPMVTVAVLTGDNLRAVASHVIEALRQADYKVTDLSSERKDPFYLPEAVGVRLGLVFMAVKPLSKHRRVEAISYGIRQMPPEEAYYWYSKCTDTDAADRAQRALRILLATE